MTGTILFRMALVLLCIFVTTAFAGTWEGKLVRKDGSTFLRLDGGDETTDILVHSVADSYVGKKVSIEGKYGDNLILPESIFTKGISNFEGNRGRGVLLKGRVLSKGPGQNFLVPSQEHIKDKIGTQPLRIVFADGAPYSEFSQMDYFRVIVRGVVIGDTIHVLTEGYAPFHVAQGWRKSQKGDLVSFTGSLGRIGYADPNPDIVYREHFSRDALILQTVRPTSSYLRSNYGMSRSGDFYPNAEEVRVTDHETGVVDVLQGQEAQSLYVSVSDWLSPESARLLRRGDAILISGRMDNSDSMTVTEVSHPDEDYWVEQPAPVATIEGQSCENLTSH